MHELMAVLQEVRTEDVHKSQEAHCLAAPSAPPNAVAEPATESADPDEATAPIEKTFAAMRWATQLTNDVAVLSLIRSLP